MKNKIFKESICLIFRTCYKHKNKNNLTARYLICKINEHYKVQGTS